MVGARYGYRLSKTENGRIGLCLPGTEPGDIVAPRLDSTSFYFQGEAFIDGLVYGEALTMKDKYGLQTAYFENIWVAF